MSERGEISSTLPVLIVITVACIVVGSLIMTAKNVDYASNKSIESAISDFVTTEINKGKLSDSDVSQLEEKISNSHAGNEVVLQMSVPGENPGKKTSLDVANKQGENVLTTYFDSQLRKDLRDYGYIDIPEGATLGVKVYQLTNDIADQLTGSEGYGELIAEYSATRPTDF